MNVYRQMVEAIERAGGTVYQVGGSVRDAVMGVESDDMDSEVFGISFDQIIEAVSPFGAAKFMGAEFGIVSVTVDGEKFDFSIPRRDNKVGKGHAGFVSEFDPNMTIAQAAARRDFTMNAISMGTDGQIHDPFNGAADIRAGVIRHTSAAFSEDPVRVIRGIRFASRFGFRMARETAKVCGAIRSEFKDIDPNRMWKEWRKWAETCTVPSKGMAVMYASGWIWEWPEIAAMVGVPQNPRYHPEGSCYIHSCQVMDAAARICERDGIVGDERVVVMFGAMCHDMGKPVTTVQNENGDWVSPGHAEAGVEIAERFMRSISAPERIVVMVGEMVRFHMRHIDFSARSARRIATQMTAPIACIAAVIEADHSGRGTMPSGMPEAGAAFIEAMQAAAVEVANPFVMGRHMIERGVRPGPTMGAAIRATFEAQIEGSVTNFEEAIEFAMTFV